MRKLVLFWIVSHLFVFHADAQISVSSEVPAPAQHPVCQDNPAFTFTLISQNIPSAGIAISIALPEGMTMVPGSLVNLVPGGRQVTLQSGTGRVITLTGENLDVGDSLRFSILTATACETYAQLVAGTALHDTVNVTYNGAQTAQHITPQFNAAFEFANLNIVQPVPPTGAIGNVVTREVKIGNSHNGCLDSFWWSDAHGSDITVDSVFLGTVKLNTTRSGDTIRYQFSEADFVAVGNFDNLFCQGELITLTEYITLDGCASKQSDIVVEWGCGTSRCAGFATTGDVITPVDPPDLEFTWYQVDMPSCFHEQSNTKGVVIRNTGVGPAREIDFQVKKFFYTGQFEEYKYDGFDTSQIYFRLNDQPFQKVIPHTPEPNYHFTGCSQPLFYRFVVSIPELLPGDSATLEFDMINCPPDTLQPGEVIKQGAIGFDYWFNNDCLDNPITVTNRPVVGGHTIELAASNYDSPSLIDEVPATFITSIQSLTADYPGNGEFIVRYILPPCGVDSAVNISQVKWQNYTGVSWNPYHFEQSGDTISTYFDLTNKPIWFSLSGSEVKLSVQGGCGCGAPYEEEIIRSIYYIPHSNCILPVNIRLLQDTIPLQVDPCNYFPCTGARMRELSIERSNTGMADDDLDRLPDGGEADREKIRLDRLRLGDTLSTRVMAYTVDSTGYGYGFVETTLDLGDYFTPVGGSVRIWDSQNSRYISCDTVLMSQLSPTEFQTNFSPVSLSLHCADLVGYAFQYGDTIWVTSQFKLTSLIPGTVANGKVAPVRVYLKTSPVSPAYKCGDSPFSGIFQVVNMVESSASSNVISHSCGRAISRTTIKMHTGGGSNDMFPAEYRPWSFPDTLYIDRPAGFEYVEAEATLKTPPHTVTYKPTPVDPAANPLVFLIGDQIGQLGWDLPDDGYEIDFQTQWNPSCEAPDDQDQRFALTPSFTWQPGLEAFDSAWVWNPAVRHDNPNLGFVNIGPARKDGLGREVTWQVRLQNSSALSTANHAFISFASPSQLIQVARLVDKVTGMEIEPLGDIYRLGDLGPTENREFIITAIYDNCEQDSLVVRAGWDCQGYPSDLTEYTCGGDMAEFNLRVDSKPSSLQVTLIDQPLTEVSFCDDLFYEVRLASNSLANVKDLLLDVTHDGNGIALQAGSLEFEYPAGTGFRPFANAGLIPGGFQLDFTQADSLLTAVGLEGIAGDDPNLRSMRVRFLAEMNCDFENGDALSFTLHGNRPCGAPLDPVSVESQEILYPSPLIPYATAIQMSVDTVMGCVESFPVKIKVSPFGGSTGARDGIKVILPPAFTYKSFSFTGVHNPPGVVEPIVRPLNNNLGLELDWPVPAGVEAGDSIVFEFEVLATPDLGCPDQAEMITGFTYFVTDINCRGTFCSTFQEVTGDFAKEIPLSKPRLAFTDIYDILSEEDDIFTHHLFVEMYNSGSAIAATAPTTIEFFCDADRNQIFSAADRFVGAYSEMVEVAANGMLSFQVDLPIVDGFCDPADGIIAVIRTDPDPVSGPAQCACEAVNSSLAAQPIQALLWEEFTGKTETYLNFLEWTITGGIANTEFHVERKNENGDWEILGTVPYSPGEERFYFRDEAPLLTGIYRIKHINAGGIFIVSDELELLRKEVDLIRAYPVPVTESFFVDLYHDTQYRLINSQGLTVKTGTLPSGMKREIRIEPGIIAGIYQLHLKSENGEKTLKILIK